LNGDLPGRYESDEARAARITDELKRSKELLERSLEKEVNFVCWPGGANDKTVQKKARKLGYGSWDLSSGSQLVQEFATPT